MKVYETARNLLDNPRQSDFQNMYTQLAPHARKTNLFKQLLMIYCIGFEIITTLFDIFACKTNLFDQLLMISCIDKKILRLSILHIDPIGFNYY